MNCKNCSYAKTRKFCYVTVKDIYCPIRISKRKKKISEITEIKRIKEVTNELLRLAGE